MYIASHFSTAMIKMNSRRSSDRRGSLYPENQRDAQMLGSEQISDGRGLLSDSDSDEESHIGVAGGHGNTFGKARDTHTFHAR